MSPCRLCPNWRDRKQDEKGKYRTWFDLPASVKAATGLQVVFTGDYDTAPHDEGDDAAAGAPAVAEPRPASRRGLEDW